MVSIIHEVRDKHISHATLPGKESFVREPVRDFDHTWIRLAPKAKHCKNGFGTVIVKCNCKHSKNKFKSPKN